jgi:hypothetical protein
MVWTEKGPRKSSAVGGMRRVGHARADGNLGFGGARRSAQHSKQTNAYKLDASYTTLVVKR